jgi:hypothetical protein
MRQLEVAELPGIFVDVSNVIGGLLLLAGLCVAGAVLLDWFDRSRYGLVMIGAGVFLSLISVFIFFSAMQRLTEVSIGPVIGSGMSSAMVGMVEYQISASWGFSLGFFLVIASILCGLICIIKKGYCWLVYAKDMISSAKLRAKRK